MDDITSKAWTCINRWERRGYDGQVEIFKAVMADNERLRKALKYTAGKIDNLTDCGPEDRDRFSHIIADIEAHTRAALEGK